MAATTITLGLPVLMYLSMMMPMAAFIDPRADPKACATKPCVRTTADPGALADLHRLSHDGRLYDVERWIQAGRPLQVAQGTTVKQRRLTSVFEIALEAGNYALALLLCNGYDPNIESCCPLDLALRARRRDLLDLLLEWGAYVHRVSLSDLFDSYSSKLQDPQDAHASPRTEARILAAASETATPKIRTRNGSEGESTIRWSGRGRITACACSCRCGLTAARTL